MLFSQQPVDAHAEEAARDGACSSKARAAETAPPVQPGSMRIIHFLRDRPTYRLPGQRVGGGGGRALFLDLGQAADELGTLQEPPSLWSRRCSVTASAVEIKRSGRSAAGRGCRPAEPPPPPASTWCRQLVNSSPSSAALPSSRKTASLSSAKMPNSVVQSACSSAIAGRTGCVSHMAPIGRPGWGVDYSATATRCRSRTWSASPAPVVDGEEEHGFTTDSPQGPGRFCHRGIRRLNFPAVISAIYRAVPTNIIRCAEAVRRRVRRAAWYHHRRPHN